MIPTRAARGCLFNGLSVPLLLFLSAGTFRWPMGRLFVAGGEAHATATPSRLTPFV